MDDYITKPIVRETFIKVLGKWLNYDILPLEPVALEAHFSDDLHFNTENLRNNIGDDKKFLEKVLSMAKKNLNNSLPELDESIKNQEIESIRSIAHRMKGTALSACFDVLAKQLNQLESIKSFTHSDIEDAATGIKNEIIYLNTINN